MKKLLALSVFILLIVFVPVSQANAQASPGVYTAGPVDIQQLQAESGPEAGMVTLKWSQARSDTANFHIGYGLAPNNDLYGALNVGRANADLGNANRYTIKALTPGVTYYFHLIAVRADGTANYISKYVVATAASGNTTNTFFTGPVGKHQLIATPGPGSGQVTLNWQKYWGDVTNYHVVYGLTPGAMKWGALNIGVTGQYTVGALTPGVTYYFALVPVRSGQAAYTGISVVGTAK